MQNFKLNSQLPFAASTVQAWHIPKEMTRNVYSDDVNKPSSFHLQHCFAVTDLTVDTSLAQNTSKVWMSHAVMLN
jgi:hypothetical protein